VHPAAALVRALARTSGEAALRRGLPVYLGLLAFAGLLFGGNGLEARTVVAGAEASLLARALLWAGWLVLLAPTLAAIWQTPTSLWLRSLPAPRWWHLAIALAMSLVAQSLWTVLWFAGGGPIAGLAACGGALLGHATLLARPQGPVGLASLAASFAGLMLAPLWLLAFGTWPMRQMRPPRHGPLSSARRPCIRRTCPSISSSWRRSAAGPRTRKRPCSGP
jgi:hypothetical protein